MKFMEDHEVRALEHVIALLQRRFPEVPRERVTTEVMDLYHHYEFSKVRGYLAILIEREARERLANADLSPAVA